MARDAPLLLAVLAPLACYATSVRYLRLEGSQCFFHMDVALFLANGTGDCPVRAVLDVLHSIPGHKACCRECSARSGAAGTACHAFTWDSTNMDCSLYAEEPANVCDLQDQEGAISGQVMPKGSAKLEFPLRASMRDVTPRRNTKVFGKRRGLQPSTQLEAGPPSAPPSFILQPSSHMPPADAGE